MARMALSTRYDSILRERATTTQAPASITTLFFTFSTMPQWTNLSPCQQDALVQNLDPQIAIYTACAAATDPSRYAASCLCDTASDSIMSRINTFRSGCQSGSLPTDSSFPSYDSGASAAFIDFCAINGTKTGLNFPIQSQTVSDTSPTASLPQTVTHELYTFIRTTQSSAISVSAPYYTLSTIPGYQDADACDLEAVADNIEPQRASYAGCTSELGPSPYASCLCHIASSSAKINVLKYNTDCHYERTGQNAIAGKLFDNFCSLVDGKTPASTSVTTTTYQSSSANSTSWHSPTASVYSQPGGNPDDSGLRNLGVGVMEMIVGPVLGVVVLVSVTACFCCWWKRSSEKREQRFLADARSTATIQLPKEPVTSQNTAIASGTLRKSSGTHASHDPEVVESIRISTQSETAAQPSLRHEHGSVLSYGSSTQIGTDDHRNDQ